MSSFTNNQNPLHQKVNQQDELKNNDNCLICKIMEIRNEKAKIVNWVLSGDESSDDKAKLASSLTGIDFDSELIECLNEPSVKNLLLSE